MKASRFCRCGAALDAQGSMDAVAFVVAQFDETHTGDGHGRVTRQEAANARRREERALMREYAARWDEGRASRG